MEMVFERHLQQELVVHHGIVIILTLLEFTVCSWSVMLASMMVLIIQICSVLAVILGIAFATLDSVRLWSCHNIIYREEILNSEKI